MASKAADVDAPGPLIDLGMAPANGNGAIYPKFSKRSWKEWVKFLHYGLGILVTIGAYSFLQERIVSKRYEGEIFKATMFLVLCNRLVSIVYALIMIMVKGESWRMQAIVWKYLVVSFSNMLSTWCQYESLRYVSLILQTMAKTFKMLPVMLVGMVISRKRHSLREVCVVTLLTLGLSLFVAGGNVSSENAEGSSFYGICLLMAFLVFDSFTSNFQEKLFKEDNMSKYNQMLYMNLSSALVSTCLLVFGGMLPYSLAFLDHPGFASHVLMLSLSAAAGQYYIFSMVQSFGALALAAAMNARQVSTIFLSYLTQTQPLTWIQRMGLFILCFSLMMKASCSFILEPDVKQLSGQDPPKEVELEDAEEGELESLVRGGSQSKMELAHVLGAKSSATEG